MNARPPILPISTTSARGEYEMSNQIIINAKSQTAKSIQGLIDVKRDPILRKLLSGEVIKKEEEGYLTACADIIEMIDDHVSSFDTDEE